MTMTSQFRWAYATAALAALTSFGCGGATQPGAPMPVAPGGECPKMDASAPAPDGCNTCVCTNGTWSCTEKSCAPSMECTPGQVKAQDCNQCTCNAAGQWQCTTIYCFKACGARAGNTCASNEYCAYQAGEYCGAADAEAQCQLRPDVCTTDYAPVCGCDQKTYSNTCSAAMAGTGVNTSGPCP